MNKLLTIACGILLITSLLGCDQINKSSPKDQAQKHYKQLKPLLDNAVQCLDYLYVLDDNLCYGTVTLDYGMQRTNELKKNFALQQDALKQLKVPADFNNEWNLVQQWLAQGAQMFDLMADTIVKEKAGGGSAFYKSLSAWVPAQKKEYQLYDNMNRAYDSKMTALGFDTNYDIAEKHYGQFKPLVENTSFCLDNLHDVWGDLDGGRISEDYATQRIYELKQIFCLQKKNLERTKVPADFQNTWVSVQKWFDRGRELFSLIEDMVPIKNKIGMGCYELFLDASEKELTAYENMIKEYDTKMNKFGFKMAIKNRRYKAKCWETHISTMEEIF